MKGFEGTFLRTIPKNLIATGVALVSVVFGLSLFLEGLKLGVMPLGEAAGKVILHHAHQTHSSRLK